MATGGWQAAVAPGPKDFPQNPTSTPHPQGSGDEHTPSDSGKWVCPNSIKSEGVFYKNLYKTIRWWAQKDLNLRPADYESDALNQLSYGPLKGGDKQNVIPKPTLGELD